MPRARRALAARTFVAKFRCYVYWRLRHSEWLQRVTDPTYDCDHCHEGDNPGIRDEALAPNCPKCPLTRNRSRLYSGWPGVGGLRRDWAVRFDEGKELDEQERHLAYTLGVVWLALSMLPEGQTVDPTWTPEFGELVAAYQAELAYVRRLVQWRPPTPEG